MWVKCGKLKGGGPDTGFALPSLDVFWFRVWLCIFEAICCAYFGDWVFVDTDVGMVWITCVYILYILGFGDFWGSIETRTCAFLKSFNISLTTNIHIFLTTNIPIFELLKGN